LKITVKVNPRAGKTPASIVRARLEKTSAKATVEEVFPGETTGRRAGLVMVNLPDDVSEEESDQVMEQLRGGDEIEYVEPERPRTPKR
jgi:hypothetical protein